MSFEIDYIGKAKTEKKDLKKIGVVIPAYNECPFGKKGGLMDVVVKGLIDLKSSHNLKLSNVVIVNDASTDKTAEVLDDLFKTYHIETVDNPKNLGQEGSVKNGIDHLIDTNLNRDLEGIVTLDADGQHDPVCIPYLALLDDGYNMVIGSRERREMPLDRRIANDYVNVIFSLLGGLKLRDIQSGFRVYDIQSARYLADALDDDGRYLIQHDVTLLLLKKAFEENSNFRIAEVDIPCRYHNLRKSHIQWKNVWRLLRKTFKTALEIRKYR